MNYTFIQLKGYNRFMLNGFRNFEMKIVALLQLVLGTNGGGKSSLLWELSPLPAEAKDFQKGGKKVIHITHNGKFYELINDFGADKVHSFIVDGENLNPGGTVTVQYSLVKNHFGITSDVRKLLIGHDRFTTMRAQQRKEWFLKLCPVDYDYAISVFNKLKERLRDVSGSIKLDKRNLVHESNLLLSDEKVNALTAEAEELHQMLNHLLEWRKPVESDTDILDMRMLDMFSEMTRVAKSLDESLAKLADPQIEEAQYRQRIADLDTGITAYKTLINHVGGELESVCAKLDTIKRAEKKTVDDLQIEYDQKVNYCCSAIESSLLKKVVEDPRDAYLQFCAVRDGLIEICTEIPVNKDRIYSSQALSEKKALHGDLIMRRAGLLEQLSRLSAELAHMLKHKDDKDVACPKCEHSFSLVYNEERVERLHQQVARLEADKLTLAKQIEEVQEYMDACNEYAKLFRQWKNIQAMCKSPAPYWVMMEESGLLYSNPTQLLGVFDQIEKDILLQIQVSVEKERTEEIWKTLESLKTVGSASLAELQQLHQEKSSILESNVQALNEHLQLKNATMVQLNYLLVKEKLAARLKELLNASRALQKEKNETYRRESLNALIRQLQSQLASCEHLLAESKIQKSVVQNLSDGILKKEQEEKALAVLIDELSPHGGLIAEGLLGFINNYVAEMNDLIEQVWTYPLVIESCDILDGEVVDLDYKFPFVVGANQHPVKDVTEGSSAQLEIFDLAYRITAMKYLGLADSALYLDEFSRSFDKEHRSAATLLIKMLVEQQSFPQIFMVSHYLEVYGGLANMDVVALNTNNVIVPHAHNLHVTLS